MRKPTKPEKPKKILPEKPQKYEEFVLVETTEVTEARTIRGDNPYACILEEEVLKSFSKKDLDLYQNIDKVDKEDWLYDIKWSMLRPSREAVTARTFEILEESTGRSKYDFKAVENRNIDGYFSHFSFIADSLELELKLSEWHDECGRINAQYQRDIASYKDKLAKYKVDKASYDLWVAQEKYNQHRSVDEKASNQ